MENLKEERKGFESLGLSYPVNETVKVEHKVIAGVETYLFIPSEIVSGEIVVFLHGGGFIYGSVRSHRAMVSHIAAATGRRMLFIEYSLAPEKPFPHALNEATAVIEALIHSNPNVQFALMGDSAGGNLALSTALNLKQRNLWQPLYQVLISPWLNVEPVYDSYAENEKVDPILTYEFITYAASQYTNHKNYMDPLVSPVFGYFVGFNPTLTMVGKKEILRDDSLQLHETLKKAGCISKLKVFDDVTHVWTLTDIASAESKEALNIMREFMDTVTSVIQTVEQRD